MECPFVTEPQRARGAAAAPVATVKKHRNSQKTRRWRRCGRVAAQTTNVGKQMIREFRSQARQGNGSAPATQTWPRAVKCPVPGGEGERVGLFQYFRCFSLQPGKFCPEILTTIKVIGVKMRKGTATDISFPGM